MLTKINLMSWELKLKADEINQSEIYILKASLSILSKIERL